MTRPDDIDVLAGWGERLAAARGRAGLSQQALANELGVTAKTVYRWESVGRRGDTSRPHTAHQRRIAEILGDPVTELFPRNDRETVLEGIAAEYDDLLERVGGGCS